MTTYNPDKPCYQTNWSLPDFIAKTHPGLNVVSIEREDPAEAIRRHEMQRGADMMWWGMWVAIGCAVAHGIIKSSYPMLKPFAKFLEWGIVGGVLAVVVGMLYKNVTQYAKSGLRGHLTHSELLQSPESTDHVLLNNIFIF